MKFALVLIVLAFAAAGCASHHELAQCDGPLEALNASHWQPTQAELDALSARLN